MRVADYGFEMLDNPAGEVRNQAVVLVAGCLVKEEGVRERVEGLKDKVREQVMKKYEDLKRGNGTTNSNSAATNLKKKKK